MDSTRKGQKGRCFLCRTSTQVVSLFTSAASMLNPNASWSKSCLESMCRLISIPDKHPCKQFFMTGRYCADCIQLIRDIDFTLKSLDNFQQQILGFREDFFTKLGDNYKAIPNLNMMKVNLEDIERSNISEKVFFGFDEVIKITFNKIEKEKCKWTSTDFMKGSASDANSTNFHSKKGGNDLPCDEFNVDNDNDPDWVASDGDGKMFDDLENDSAIFRESENTDKKLTVVKDCMKSPTTSNKNFKCPEGNCDVSLGSAIALRIHIRKVHEGDPKPYHCNHCELRFQYDANLIIHKKSHRIKFNLKCKFCDFSCGKKSSLKAHVKKIHEVLMSQCQYCGVEFENEDHLEHENLHRKSDTPFKCLTCESMFTNSVDLKRHMHTHDSTTIICDACGMRFRSELNLLVHKKNIHDLSFVEFQCKVCGLRNASKSSLERHMATHSNEKKFVCEVCGDAFKLKSSFDRHRKRHLGIFPFSCKICGKGFTASGPLKPHEEKHSGIFAYDCSACDKKFKTRANLNQHINKHCPNIERSKDSSSKKRVRKKKNTTVAITDEESNSETNNTDSRFKEGIDNRRMPVERKVKFSTSHSDKNESCFNNRNYNGGEGRTDSFKSCTVDYELQNQDEVSTAVSSIAQYCYSNVL